MPKPNDPQKPDDTRKAPLVPARSKDIDSTLPPGADVEERFNEFWKNNGTAIFAAIALGALVVLGLQTWRYLENRAEQKTRQAFAQAGDRQALTAFAQDNEDHSLAGIAYLQLANEDYNRGEYAQAREHYHLATERLAGTALAGRAAIGAAMAALVGGSEAEGTQALRDILNNPAHQNTTRTEAGHALAVHYWEQQDWQAMREVVDTVLTFDASLPYRMITEQLSQRVPQLQQ